MPNFILGYIIGSIVTITILSSFLAYAKLLLKKAIKINNQAISKHEETLRDIDEVKKIIGIEGID